ncbi:MAG TPA: DUF4129 domain-containing protein [Actinomycetota bacterium]|nr:DUF4129 domain-containing protein [Actinomycetota bacterium]
MLLQRVDPSEAQEVARRILSERRFRAPDVPRPLEGVLDPVGRALRDAWEAFAGVLDDVLPGPRAVVWTVLAIVVVLAAVAVAAVMSRRRGVGVAGDRLSSSHPARRDPRAVEALADEAERAHDFATAVRLRFRAGLLRLEAAGRIRGADSTTSREVARRLRSPRFDHLAALFDQIVYGGRPATAADAETSRSGWDALLRPSAERRRS